MANKYLLNSPEGAVKDHLKGIALSNDSVLLIEDVNAIVRKDYAELSPSKKVFLISGGGAGHEPMFAGFVAKGHLSAAVSGEFFASPSMGQIVKTVETICQKDDQILFLVANYTGDRLNFCLAKETLLQNGYQSIEMFCFGDDISGSLQHKDRPLKHRRGLAGIDFLIRIAGQASEDGQSLQSIVELVKSESAKICTISVSLSGCDIPAVGSSFELQDDEMELGLGIHGEPGVARIRIEPTKNTVGKMMSSIMDYYLKDESQNLKNLPNTELHILVNNLGSMTTMELNIIKKEIVELFNSDRLWAAFRLRSIESRTVMSSFNMKGFSISAYSGKKLTNLRMQPASTEYSIQSKRSIEKENQKELLALNRIVDQSLLIEIIHQAADSLIKNREQLNCCDSAGGDSDCGSTMARLAELILEHARGSKSVTFSSIARTVSGKIGGTSGAIYGLLFFFASDFIVHHSSQFVGSKGAGGKFWCELLKFSTDKLSEYSGAQRGDRTMIDALWALESGLRKLSDPAGVELSLHCQLSQLKKDIIAANEHIATFTPGAGRSANVDPELVKSQSDPGSLAVTLWAGAIIDTLLKTMNKA